MNVERIKFERTGGFAGIRLAADFEITDLPEDQARSLLELLDNLDFENLPEQMLDSMPIADGFTYSITIETKKSTHTVNAGESSVTEKLEPLLALLNQIARKQARK